jgi:hypothetical protein
MVEGNVLFNRILVVLVHKAHHSILETTLDQYLQILRLKVLVNQIRHSDFCQPVVRCNGCWIDIKRFVVIFRKVRLVLPL